MIIILLLFFFFFQAQLVQSAVYHVATTGTNPSCANSDYTTTARAKSTVAAGLACLASGDTLYIHPGTYVERIAYTQVPNGTSDLARTVISGAPGTVRTAVLRPSVSGPSIIDVSNKNWVTYNNLKLDGTNLNSHVVGGDSGEVENVTISNSEIFTTTKNAGGDGCISFGLGTNTGVSKIIGNLIHDCGSGDPGGSGLPPGHGVYSGSNGLIIDGNTIYNIVESGYSVHVYMSPGYPRVNNNIVRNNIIRDSAYGILLGSGTGHKAYNNIIYNLSYPGYPGYARAFEIDGNLVSGGGTQLIYSNTVYNVSGTSTLIRSDSTKSEIRNNIFSDTDGASDSGSGTVFSNNLCSSTSTGCTFSLTEAASATFVSTSTNDFHLKTGSKAIGGGTPLPAQFAVDFDGNARPIGGTWDSGAYEFASEFAPPTVSINLPAGCVGTSTACTISSSSVTLTGTGTNFVSIGWTNDPLRNPTSSSSMTAATDWTTTTGSPTAIPLLPGKNNLTVTVAAGAVTVSDTIEVTYAPSFPGNTLAGSWGFNEGSGTTVLDSSGNANTGTLINGAALTNTLHVHDKGISLDGADAYMNVPDSNSLDFTQSFTLSGWVTLTASGGWQGLITKGQSYNAQNWPVQFLYASGANNTSMDSACTSGSIQAGFTANGVLGGTAATGASSNGVNIICGPPLPTNTPTFVAVTYDGTNLKLAVSGRATITKAATGYMEPTDASKPLIIGSDDYADVLGGTVSSPRVYNYALPLSVGKQNVTFGAACDYTDATPSIIQNANCGIIPPLSPVDIKIPATPDALKIGAGAVIRFGARP